MWDNNFIRHFKGHFEGAKTFKNRCLGRCNVKSFTYSNFTNFIKKFKRGRKKINTAHHVVINTYPMVWVTLSENTVVNINKHSEKSSVSVQYIKYALERPTNEPLLVVFISTYNWQRTGGVHASCEHP